jgi:hypothetical protein
MNFLKKTKDPKAMPWDLLLIILTYLRLSIIVTGPTLGPRGLSSAAPLTAEFGSGTVMMAVLLSFLFWLSKTCRE